VARLLALHRRYQELERARDQAMAPSGGADWRGSPGMGGEGGGDGVAREEFRLRGVHCLAGLVGLNGSHAAAQALLTLLEWCGDDANCIAPLGANLSSHRYEQAALSVAAQLLGISCHTDPRYWGFFRSSGEPSVALPDDELASSPQVVFARRRHIHKPFLRHVQRVARVCDSDRGAGAPGAGAGAACDSSGAGAGAARDSSGAHQAPAPLSRLKAF